MLGKKKKIPVVLITGYLGSGKTTLLNELLKQEKRKVAVIVNDMGEINVDAKFLRDNAAVEMGSTMIELSNGCICCTLRDEFMHEIDKLSSQKELEAIFVEASGVSDPASIAAAFLSYTEVNPKSGIYLSNIVTVVDVNRIQKEFMSELAKCIEDIEVHQLAEDPDIINLVIDQIEFCNMIILNKCDTLSEQAIEDVKVVIRQLQREAEFVESIYGKVDIDKIVKKQRFEYEKVMNSSLIQKALADQKNREVHEETYGISSFVFEEKRPFNRAKFMSFMEALPENVIRSKGYIWFSDDDIHVQLVEQAGRNATISEASNWVAAFTEDEQKEVIESYPEIMDEWDETYGDRFNQLVIIGKGIDKIYINNSLRECLED